MHTNSNEIAGCYILSSFTNGHFAYSTNKLNYWLSFPRLRRFAGIVINHVNAIDLRE